MAEQNDEKLARAYRVLVDTAAEFDIVIDSPEQLISFGFLPAESVRRFGERIREQQYSIDPQDFLDWQERGVAYGVGSLVAELAGKDDTPGNE